MAGLNKALNAEISWEFLLLLSNFHFFSLRVRIVKYPEPILIFVKSAPLVKAIDLVNNLLK